MQWYFSCSVVSTLVQAAVTSVSLGKLREGVQKWELFLTSGNPQRRVSPSGNIKRGGSFLGLIRSQADETVFEVASWGVLSLQSP